MDCHFQICNEFMCNVFAHIYASHGWYFDGCISLSDVEIVFYTLHLVYKLARETILIVIHVYPVIKYTP